MIRRWFRDLGPCFLFMAVLLVGPAGTLGMDETEGSAPEIKGYTQAIDDVTIGLPEAGRIAALQVEEGHAVQKGQTLLYLDKNLEALEVEHRRLQHAMRAELEFARQRVKVLNQQYDSAKRLLENGAAISREEFEAKALEYAQARAEASRLETREQIELIELNLARERLDRRILKAPVSGTVAELLKRTGESVQAHEPVVRLVNASRARFVGSAEERNGRRLKVGQQVCLQIHSAPENVWRRARLSFVSPTVDTASGLVEVKAEFENPEPMVRLGSEATLTLPRSDADTCP